MQQVLANCNCWGSWGRGDVSFLGCVRLCVDEPVPARLD